MNPLEDDPPSSLQTPGSRPKLRQQTEQRPVAFSLVGIPYSRCEGGIIIGYFGVGLGSKFPLCAPAH